MRSEEAHIGKRVRVREPLHRADFKGKEGTIRARWGAPDYVALDVMLDDNGGSQLFWYHELEEVGDGARP